MADTETHFVVTVDVRKIVTTKQLHEKRDKSTVANIIVSAPTLESLKDKASAHLALVEDGGDISERITRGE